MASAQRAVRSAVRRDDALFRDAMAALEARLGTVDMLRFLRLLGGGRDRYEEIRRPLAGMPTGELDRELREFMRRRRGRRAQ